MNAFGFLPGYENEMVLSGKEPLVLCLLAFLITFALTRLYTRLGRARGWGSGSVAGGVHLHHMVVGIIIILVSGLAAVAVSPGSPGRELIGIFFGVGAALTLDEFALWLYLRDVYWCPEGRSSIDAIIMGVLLAALLLVGSSPFGVDGGSGSRLIAFLMVAVNVVLAVVTFLKGKLLLGMLAVFVPIVGLVAAVRLAKPRSLWSKWFYRTHPNKMARARARFDEGPMRLRRVRDRLDDLVGGAPSFAVAPPQMEVIRGRLMVRTPDRR